MRVYICAPNMYREETQKIAEFLGKHGHKVNYSAKDLYMASRPDEMFLNTMVLIRNSDVFIAYFTKKGDYGADFGVQVGMAAEAGKPVIGYIELEEEQITSLYTRLNEDILFSSAFSKIFTDLEKFANFLLLM